MKIIKASELWNREGLENFSQKSTRKLANEGAFGLYLYPQNSSLSAIKQTNWPIKKHLKGLVSSSTGQAKDLYIALQHKYIKFFKENKHLLEHIPGLCRLATSIEGEIFLLCQDGGSVDILRNNDRIKGLSHGNHFGFVFLNGKCVSPGYNFFNKEITFDDLYVIEKQIQEYEKKISISSAKTQWLMGPAGTSSEKKDEAPLQDLISPCNLVDELNKISKKIKGNKQALFGSILQTIFEAINAVDVSFDPQQMPGNVDDFHKFCMNTVAKKVPNLKHYFPLAKETFRSYCKGKGTSTSQKPYCSWSRKQGSMEKYWTDITQKIFH